jgi:DNA gyrase inhibitor GyrI
MNLDLKEISKAWFNVMVHSPEQKNLADKRFDICLECPSKKEVFKNKAWSLKCGECGCPLKAKVYTEYTYRDANKSCPLNKWKEVEDEHLQNINLNRTIL